MSLFWTISDTKNSRSDAKLILIKLCNIIYVIYVIFVIYAIHVYFYVNYT